MQTKGLRSYVETKEVTPTNILGRFDLVSYILDTNPKLSYDSTVTLLRKNKQITDEIFQNFETYFYTCGYVNIIKAMDLEETCESLLCNHCNHLKTMTAKAEGLESSIIQKCQELANLSDK